MDEGNRGWKEGKTVTEQRKDGKLMRLKKEKMGSKFKLFKFTMMVILMFINRCCIFSNKIALIPLCLIL